jgi:peptidoglycan/LPS O-acetylase OafA/YrhL
MTHQESQGSIPQATTDPVPVRLEGLDSLRAYAASAIIVFHMVHAANAELPPALEFIRNYFGFGVPLFFVVSAFSLTFGYIQRFGTPGDIGAFYIRRLARIAPLFYCMLVFQLLHIFLTSGIKKDMAEVVASLTFTFNFIPRYVDGIVPASWSIGVEMVFYLVFPVTLVFARHAIGSICVVGLSLFVASQSYLDFTAAKELNVNFIYHGFLTSVPFFAFGILFYHCFSFLSGASLARTPRARLLWACALLVTGASLVLVLILYVPLYLYFWQLGLRVLWDSLWSIPFGLVCVGLALRPVGLLSNPVTRYLGKISFSLYLTHPTIVHYFGKWGVYTAIYGTIASSKLAAFLISFAVTMLVVAAVSSLTYRWIEAPGMQLGKRLLKRRRPTALRVSTW